MFDESVSPLDGNIVPPPQMLLCVGGTNGAASTALGAANGDTGVVNGSGVGRTDCGMKSLADGSNCRSDDGLRLFSSV